MLKRGRQSEARGENSAKQEYLLMEEEQEANLYIAQNSQANLPRGSFKFSLWSAQLLLDEKCASLSFIITSHTRWLYFWPSDLVFLAMYQLIFIGVS